MNLIDLGDMVCYRVKLLQRGPDLCDKRTAVCVVDCCGMNDGVIAEVNHNMTDLGMLFTIQKNKITAFQTV